MLGSMTVAPSVAPSFAGMSREAGAPEHDHVGAVGAHGGASHLQDPQPGAVRVGIHLQHSHLERPHRRQAARQAEARHVFELRGHPRGPRREDREAAAELTCQVQRRFLDADDGDRDQLTGVLQAGVGEAGDDYRVVVRRLFPDQREHRRDRSRLLFLRLDRGRALVRVGDRQLRPGVLHRFQLAPQPVGHARRRVRVDDEDLHQASISPCRTRAMNCPRPGRALTVPSRHTTSPREMVVTGHPRTRIPSNAV